MIRLTITTAGPFKDDPPETVTIESERHSSAIDIESMAELLGRLLLAYGYEPENVRALLAGGGE